MCALFGVLDYKGLVTHSALKRIIACLSICSEARGTDASGIAYNKNEQIIIQKCPKRASKIHWKFPVGTRCIMGHTRMTTQGHAHFNANNHPFPGKLPGVGGFALAHNGIITNDAALRKCKNLRETCILTDSYVAVQLIERANKLDFNAIKEMAEALEGIFTFTILSNHNILYIVKGENPICIYHYPEIGLYLYSSTSQIMSNAIQMMRLTGMGRFEEILVEDGEILRINPNGTLDKSTFELPISAAPSWWRSRRLTYFEPEYEETEMQLLCETFGLTREDISSLLDYGMDFDEIEAMLSDSGRLNSWAQPCYNNELEENF